MNELPPLTIVRCEHCHGRFLPHLGPCPRCGSSDLVAGEIPPSAVVLAATELQAPAAGWPAPHRLAILEGSESVRILAVVAGPLPAPGSVVSVRRTGEIYEVGSEGVSAERPLVAPSVPSGSPDTASPSPVAARKRGRRSTT